MQWRVTVASAARRPFWTSAKRDSQTNPDLQFQSRKQAEHAADITRSRLFRMRCEIIRRGNVWTMAILVIVHLTISKSLCPPEGQLLPGPVTMRTTHAQNFRTSNRQHSSKSIRAPAQRINNIAFARPVQPLVSEHLQVLRPPCLPPRQHCLGRQIDERVVSAQPLQIAAPCPHGMDHSQKCSPAGLNNSCSPTP